MRTLRTAAGLVAAAVVFTATGCGVELDRLPLPAPGVGDRSYTVHASFANALNLPAKAKVRLGGADVGEVSRMAVRDFTAEVSLRIQDNVRLPVGTRAELRTATPLGDVFVSLTPPPDSTPATPPMRDGDSIPVRSTSAAATIEEVLTTASLLVNGGAVRNLAAIANGLGRAVGDRGDKVADLIADTNRLVGALSARSDDIRVAMDRTNRLLGVLSAQQNTLDEFIDATGPALATVSGNAQQALALVRRIDAISAELEKLPAINGTEASGIITNINEISRQLNAAATSPDASLATLNQVIGPVTRTTNGAAAHADAEWSDLAVGALPDPAHPGDTTGSHLPDGSDWQAFVGSLTYTLLELRDHITGTGR
ncbi:MCE family protein MceE [Nocardia nova SH22a]|uniref:MCE family protein MceE n=1 Tax=Nocardia nova SH22a TaxID=1415166 RepID=W5TF23_9NOCA|nr:MCE family protein [Nocardia nova]AHH17759.1 MCE family protein MceE [Nocardia nova SH22a]